MNCDPNETQLNPQYEFNGMVIGYGLRPGRKKEWYYANYIGTDPVEIKKQVDYILGNSVKIMGDVMYFREDFGDFAKDLKTTPGCPIRMTGASPTLFVYGVEGTNIDIQINSNLLYVDPPIPQNTWQVQLHDKMLKSGNFTRPYLYYEYEKKSFSRPKLGWNILKKDLPRLVQLISQSIHLTELESQRLQFELEHAAETLTNSHLFVGMIDTMEITSQIPLSVSPTLSHIYRYHFYIGNAKDDVQPPVLQPLPRAKTMLLEIGGVGYED